MCCQTAAECQSSTDVEHPGDTEPKLTFHHLIFMIFTFTASQPKAALGPWLGIRLSAHAGWRPPRRLGTVAQQQ